MTSETNSTRINRSSVLLAHPQAIATITKLADSKAETDVAANANTLLNGLTIRTQKGAIAGLFGYKHYYVADILGANAPEAKIVALTKFLRAVSARKEETLDQRITAVTDLIKGSFKDPVGNSLASEFRITLDGFMGELDDLTKGKGYSETFGIAYEALKDEHGPVFADLRETISDLFVSNLPRADRDNELLLTLGKLVATDPDGHRNQEIQKNLAEIGKRRSEELSGMNKARAMLSNEYSVISGSVGQTGRVKAEFLSNQEQAEYCNSHGLDTSTKTKLEAINEHLRSQNKAHIITVITQLHVDNAARIIKELTNKMHDKRAEYIDETKTLKKAFQRLRYTQASNGEVISPFEGVMAQAMWSLDTDNESSMINEFLKLDDTKTRLIEHLTSPEHAPEDTFLSDLSTFERQALDGAIRQLAIAQEDLNSKEQLLADLEIRQEHARTAIAEPFCSLLNYQLYRDDSQLDKLAAFAQRQEELHDGLSFDSIDRISATKRSIISLERKLIEEGINASDIENITKAFFAHRDIDSFMQAMQDEPYFSTLTQVRKKTTAILEDIHSRDLTSVMNDFNKLVSYIGTGNQAVTWGEINTRLNNTGLNKINVSDTANFQSNLKVYISADTERTILSQDIERLNQILHPGEDTRIRQNQIETWLDQELQVVVEDYTDFFQGLMLAIKPQGQEAVAKLTSKIDRIVRDYSKCEEGTIMHSLVKMFNDLLRMLESLVIAPSKESASNSRSSRHIPTISL